MTFPEGKSLIQTVDFFTPLVNDPFRFGQIAAANALSDVYAMGGVPYAAMNIVCFPSKSMDLSVLKAILAGGYSKIHESGAVLAGGHSVDDNEMKYGLSVSGVLDAGIFASNRGLRPGDHLVLTKPVGTGVLVTAVKANIVDAPALEEIIWQVAAKLNRAGGLAISTFGLKAATDITGFGLGGHALEMSKASGLAVALDTTAVPVLDHAAELAGQGFVPAGSHANRRYFMGRTSTTPGLGQTAVDMVFDAQTSGGLLMAVPADVLNAVCGALLAAGDLAAVVGEVLSDVTNAGKLVLR